MFTRMQRRAFQFFVFCALLSGCQTAPLSNSPYQQIVKKHPQKSQFLVQVQSRLEPALNQPSAPISRLPSKEEILRTVCEGLVDTRFHCISDEKTNLRPDYIVHIGYGAIRDPFIREQIRPTRRGLRRGRFGDHDPGAEDVHLFQWRLKVENPKGEKVFQSQKNSEQFDFWEFNLKDLVRRYFSS